MPPDKEIAPIVVGAGMETNLAVQKNNSASRLAPQQNGKSLWLISADCSDSDDCFAQRDVVALIAERMRSDDGVDDVTTSFANFEYCALLQCDPLMTKRKLLQIMDSLQIYAVEVERISEADRLSEIQSQFERASWSQTFAHTWWSNLLQTPMGSAVQYDDAKQTSHIIDTLVNIYNANQNPPITDPDRNFLNQASFAVFNAHPSNLWHLALVLPTEDEIVDALFCLTNVGQHLVERIINRLNVHLRTPISKFVWSCSRQGTRQVLHWHIFGVVEEAYADEHAFSELFNAVVRDAWFDELADIQLKSGCDLFTDCNGTIHSRNGHDHLTRAVHWYERQNQHSFDSVYWNRPERIDRHLDFLQGLVTPRFGSGVSADLSALTVDQTLDVELNFSSVREAIAALTALNSVLQSAQPAEAILLKGATGRLANASNFNSAGDSLKRLAASVPSEQLHAIAIQMKLTPDRRYSIIVRRNSPDRLIE
ncbi:MAG TPA: hypothetical protein V6C81_28195 [Planktothrix sp.]|jgi:hypothetical protein